MWRSSITLPLLFWAAMVLMTQLASCSGMKLYEYYVPDDIVSSGLAAEGESFSLNGKDLKIFSGSFHYFRVHPSYWRETLTKMRAAGLNTVETYVPWNLHEPRQDEYDFGQLGEDMSMFLDLRAFVLMAQEEDLLVIVRPGPYICAEWEFGGMPSWLMRDPTMQIRTYYDKFRLAAKSYMTNVLQQLKGLQFIEGGPIIAMQIENEYGSFGYEDHPRDKLYLQYLKTVIEENSFNQTLLFTSDNNLVHYDWGSVDGALQTINFNDKPQEHVDTLKVTQPNRPVFVAEFWTGWFDSWLSGTHNGWDIEEFAPMYEELLSLDANVNLFMFIGGTNFGFLAGASNWSPEYKPLVTSYDYDAPLTESGAYTEKYDRIVEIISSYNPLQGIVDNPPMPAERPTAAYGPVSVTDVLPLFDIVAQSTTQFVTEEGPVNMEALPMNNNNGQSYGYLLYQATAALAAPNSTLLIRGHVRDMAQVMVNGTLVTQPYGGAVDDKSFGFWNGRDKSISIAGDGSETQINILVENLGRVNSGQPYSYSIQKKGLWEGHVLLDNKRLQKWIMTPLEFKQSFVKNLAGWTPFVQSLTLPSMYRANLQVETPEDTFLDMSSWGKGVVFVNGFNVGRYWSLGPQLTLYIPGALLQQGDNDILVFEQYTAADVLNFIDMPKLGTYYLSTK